MKLSSIRINGKAIEQGAWVDDIPQLPGVRLKVRGIGNKDYRRLEAKLIREVPRERRISGLDPDDADEIQEQCLAETVLLGWEGLEADNGEPMEFTSVQARALIGDPDYLVFKNAVLYASSVVAATKEADARSDAKN